MPDKTLARPVAALLCLSLAAGSSPAWASQTVHCGSEGYRYKYCRSDTDNQVRLERQFSKSRCSQGYSWGYDRRGVWVDHGCDGEFRVGHDSGGSDRAATAGAVIAGVAILAALAASSRGQQSSDVPSWAVGEYSGYDEYDRIDVRMTILPGGNVSGYAGSSAFEGRFQSSRLETARYAFRVERSGNGFVATDERDPGHRVYFRRSGGGY
jgi:hypothetical protein